MSDIAKKLEYLKGTKDAIASAIEEKEVTVPSGATFREYAQLIKQIQGGGAGNLQEGTATPTGEEFTLYPDEGFDGFSSVTVDGDMNLKSENIADGITIYGVTGTLKIGSGTTLPGEYEDYVEHAKLLYTGEYANLLVAESNGAVTVGFLLDNFKVTEYNESSTEFKASGWVAVKYIKSSSTWGMNDWSSTASEGQNYISHIRYCTCYIYYNTKIIYPAVTPEPEPTGTYTVKFVNGSTILQTVTGVVYGGRARYTGEVPTSENMFFAGWSPNPGKVYGDMICYAQFTSEVTKSEITDTWEEIIESRGENYPIGGCKDLEVTISGTTYTFRMQKVAFGEDNAKSVWLSRSTTITKIFDDNSKRWADSSVRTFLNESVYNALPDILKNAIVPMVKYTNIRDSDNQYQLNEATVDRLWLPSMQEVGKKSTSPEMETSGQVYAPFVSGSDLYKSRTAFNGKAYWLRTADYNSYSYVCWISANGYFNTIAPNRYAYCLNFGFGL